MESKHTPGPWEMSPEAYPLWKQATAALRKAGVIGALLVALTFSGCSSNPPAETEVDSSTSSHDGLVVLHLGSQEFTFAPNVARAVAEGMVESAECAERESEGGGR